MSIDHSLRGKTAWLPAAATIGYGGLVAVLMYLAGSAIADLIEHRASIAASTAMLERLQGRRAASPNGVDVADGVPTGSPFLEGPTVTVAGAALMQRVASAVDQVGGNILSSQVELQSAQFQPAQFQTAQSQMAQHQANPSPGAASKTGTVGVTINCEIEQPALQRLLYDLEAGMPYLFIDQLTAQTAVTSTGSQHGRMRVLLTVSGQWQGER